MAAMAAARTAQRRLAFDGRIARLLQLGLKNCLLALRKLGQRDLVRVALHYYNTEDEVARLAEALGEIAREGNA